VATDWGPILQTGIGAVAATGGGFAAAWMQGRSQLQLERQRRREAAADTLADATRLLENFEPDFLPTREAPAPGEPLLGERKGIRLRLLQLAAKQPSRRVRRRIGLLDTKISAVIGVSLAYLDLREAGRETEEVLTSAREVHAEARQALRKVMDAL